MNTDTKVSQNRQKKEALVAELSEKAAKSKALVFTSYQGLTHQQLEDLKRSVKAVDAEFVATKNSLLKLALGNQKIEADDSQLTQPTATLFIYNDIVTPLKELTKRTKELSLPSVKFGIMDGKLITASDVTKLATLPSREVLLGQVVGTLKSPIFGLHRALNWNLQKLVMTLNAVASQKPAA